MCRVAVERVAGVQRGSVAVVERMAGVEKRVGGGGDGVATSFLIEFRFTRS